MYCNSLDPSNSIHENNDGNISSDSSPGSSDASSSMDQYMKKLFHACDRDGDGYLDRFDLEEVSKQLGLEGDVSEILEQFGAGSSGKIAYRDFLGFKTQFTSEMDRSGNVSSSESANEASTEKEDLIKAKPKEELSVKVRPTSSNNKRTENVSSRMFTQEKLSKSHRLQKTSSLSEYLDPQTLHHLESLQVITPGTATGREQPKGTDFLEIANRLHIAALSSLKNEIYDLNSRLHHVTTERDNLRHQTNQLTSSKQKMQHDFDEKFQSQMMRVTELQSVIAELTRKLNQTTDNIIIEEDDEESPDNDGLHSPGTSDMEVEGSRCSSECSCKDGVCEHCCFKGPNQVNLLATTNDIPDDERPLPVSTVDTNNQPSVANESFDLGIEVSKVIGQIENSMNTERKKANIIETQFDRHGIRGGIDNAENEKNMASSLHTNNNGDGFDKSNSDIIQLKQKITLLVKEKTNLEKQLQKASVTDYVSRRSNAPSSSNEELNGVRIDREQLKVKLRKSEQELEEVKAVNLTIREEREKLRKKIRSLQDSVERKNSVATPPPSHTTQSSAQVRYSSQAGSVDYSSTSSPPLSRKNSLQQFIPPQGNASFRTSASSPFVPVKSSSSVTGSSPNSTLRRSGTFPVTSDLGSSVCGDDTSSGYSTILVKCLRGRIPETLLQTLTTYGTLEQVMNALLEHYEVEISEKTREKSLERERSSSQIDHLKSQNDLLLLCLEESKANCERLSALVGKYESNNTALSLALQSTDELTEAYEVMLQLQESEQDLFLANCQAAGVAQSANVDTMKSLASTRSSRSNASAASSNLQYQLTYGDDLNNFEDENVEHSYRNSAVKRRDAEIHAKMLLQKFDRKYESQITGGMSSVASARSSSQHLWDEDETSYKSRTSTASSVNSSTVDELSKEEECKLKDYIRVLKTERTTVETTVQTTVESARDVIEGIDDYSIEYDDQNRERYIEMETAVLVQELQAKREERAELKHRVYLLEKEKKSLEVRLNAREAQEHAYIVHIEHLKSEVKEQIRKRKQFMTDVNRRYANNASSQDDDICSPSLPSHGLSNDNRDDSSDSQDTSRRENKLRSRIQELVETLEKLTKNSEIRQQQTAEYIADLKRANGALVAAYEKAKKRHAARLKKFEAQLVCMSERHQAQVATLKERIITSEAIKTVNGETSL